MGLSDEVPEALLPQEGAGAGHRPHRLGKVDDAVRAHRPRHRSRSDHIITIEDPIEFVHENKKCLITQRQVHVHTDSFSRRCARRCARIPISLLVGEMRDLETIAIAIETAETGHLVFGTLHTTTASSTVDRIHRSVPGRPPGADSA